MTQNPDSTETRVVPLPAPLGRPDPRLLPVTAATAEALEVQEDAYVIERVERLSRGTSNTLIMAGLIGLAIPGILGAPILLIGLLARTKAGRVKLEKWQRGHAPRPIHTALRQINRLLDDLDRRYPPLDRRRDG